MRIQDYVNILRHRWSVILTVAIVAMVSAYGFSKIQTPLYRAEATYLVVPNRNDNGLSIVLRDSMNSYRDLALAPDQLDKVSDRLKLDLSSAWLLRHVTIQPFPENRKMIVQVDYFDPDKVSQLANAIGDNMVALVGSLNDTVEGTDKINMRVVQPARSPFLYRPQTKINVLAGAILGLILGILLAAILEMLDDSIKSPADVERFVGLTTLGTIPTIARHRPVKMSRLPALVAGRRSTQRRG